MQPQFKLCIASDLAGYDLKMEMLWRLEAKGYRIQDMGCDSSQAGDYHVYAQKVAQAVVSGACDRGISLRHRPGHGHGRQQGAGPPRCATRTSPPS